MININEQITYISPDILQVSPKISEKYLLLGTCQLGIIAGHANKYRNTVDHILVNANLSLPENPPSLPTDYAGQIISLTLRDILQEQPWDISLGYQRLKIKKEDDMKEFFQQCVERLSEQLEKLMKYNLEYGITTFVFNFQTPQRNPRGFMMPHYSFLNPIYFIDKLNEELEKKVFMYANSFIINIDRIHSVIGKRFFQDDITALISHNSIIDEFNINLDSNRIVKPTSSLDSYNVQLPIIGDYLWREIESYSRIINRVDEVKIVIFDLDDTLWRGVAADDDLTVYDMTEGWPISLIEGIKYLQSRGIIIALCSKNDYSFVQDKFKEVYGGLLDLEDFQSIRCNWNQKDANIQEILQEVNLLPESAVFVDDNPAEVESVKRRFPQIRTIGFNHYDWKRLLLWSPETQVPYITKESSNRDVRVIKSQSLPTSSDHYSQTFTLSTKLITRPDQPEFNRFFELLNKTNQFNSTGKRWRHPEVFKFIQDGGYIHIFFAKNSLYDAGLIAAAMIKDDIVHQFVLSCRIFGYNIEHAIFSNISKEKGSISVIFERTDRNTVAREFLKLFDPKLPNIITLQYDDLKNLVPENLDWE